jgi:hypothetical protein
LRSASNQTYDEPVVERERIPHWSRLFGRLIDRS